MEERLEQVKKLAGLEKERRAAMKKTKEGTMWRSGTTKHKIKGYTKEVMDY